MKKFFILTLLIISLNFSLIAQQLLANAGENQHFCFQTDWIMLTLGGNPTASGGTPPYTYCWYSNEYQMFSDTTESNPHLTFLGNTEIYLKVTDNVGAISFDTVIFTMSERQLDFSDSHQYLQTHYYINSGDSVFLNGNVMTNNPNSTFYWSPCSSIVSSCNVPDGFWAKPTTTTAYSLTAKDEFNCYETFFTDFYIVHIDEIGIKNSYISDKISIYPNPASETTFLNISNYNGKINYQFFDIKGKIIFEKSINVEKDVIEVFNISNLDSGMYFVRVKTSSEVFNLKLFKK